MSDQQTQLVKILELLISARGDWVPLPNIMDRAAQYNARIWDLRRQGVRIKNRTQDVNGTRHSWFRLVSGPEMLALKSVHAAIVSVSTGPFPEFGSLAKETYGVD